MENKQENKPENEKKEKKEEKKKELKYNAATLLSKEETGKNVMITTILNSQIMGKLTRIGQFEVEILTKDGRRIIVFKHAIVSLYFFEQPDFTKGVKTPINDKP